MQSSTLKHNLGNGETKNEHNPKKPYDRSIWTAVPGPNLQTGASQSQASTVKRKLGNEPTKNQGKTSKLRTQPSHSPLPPKSSQVTTEPLPSTTAA